MVYPYHEILVNSKKELTIDTYNNVDFSIENCAETKKKKKKTELQGIYQL